MSIMSLMKETPVCLGCLPQRLRFPIRKFGIEFGCLIGGI